MTTPRRVIACLVALTAPAAVPAPAATGAVQADRYLTVVRAGTDAAAVIREHEDRGVRVRARYKHALSGFAAQMPEDAADALRRDPRVLFVQRDRPMSAAAQVLPTGVDRVDADLSSAAAGDGAGAVAVNVAVLDTGSGPHPDLNVVGGVDCSAADKIGDGNGHGTHVAGTLAARDNQRGVSGVAPGASVWSVRVLDELGAGTLSTIVCGLEWVAATRADGDLSNDIAVANLSLEGSGTDDGACGRRVGDALHVAICAAVARGVVVVAAAGNRRRDIRDVIPAAYDEVLTVTALADFDGRPGGLAMATCVEDLDDTPADFSNWASLPADRAHVIAAPGTCIASLAPRTAHLPTLSGTSMAAPHVAGAVSLCLASGACPQSSPAQIIAKLRSDAAAAPVGFGFPDARGQFGALVWTAAY